MELESIVEDLGHHVVGIAWARPQAVALAAERRPELIMADLQLADGSSGHRHGERDPVGRKQAGRASSPAIQEPILSENPRRSEAGLAAVEAVQPGFGPQSGEPRALLRPAGANRRSLRLPQSLRRRRGALRRAPPRHAKRQRDRERDQRDHEHDLRGGKRRTGDDANPSAPAIKAMTRKVIAHPNIGTLLNLFVDTMSQITNRSRQVASLFERGSS